MNSPVIGELSAQKAINADFSHLMTSSCTPFRVDFWMVDQVVLRNWIHVHVRIKLGLNWTYVKPQWAQRARPLVRKSSVMYAGSYVQSHTNSFCWDYVIILSKPWLLVPCLYVSPLHKEPCYWASRINVVRSSTREDFRYLPHTSVAVW